MATFMGAGKVEKTRGIARRLEAAMLGDLKKIARYLGAGLQDDLGTATVVDKRCKGAREAYYSMGRSWRADIPLRVKTGVFKGLVLNTLMSGMEAETLRGCDLEKMDKCLIGLARKMLGLRGVYEHAIL